MYEAIYMAATGLTNQQRRLDTIADNISNVNTTAFKSSRLDFKTALYTAGVGPTSSPDGNLQKGHGVMTSAINKNYASGTLQVTENELDFFLDGEGFFEIQDSSGKLKYTRAGNFYASNLPGGDNLVLVNSNGNYVLDENGQQIIFPANVTSVTCEQDGTLVMNYPEGDGEDGEFRVKLGIYAFPNQTGLSAAGKSNYEPTVASGEKIAAGGCTLVQGALESSNVDFANEMTRMIRSQRAFSLASRALTTADDMEGIANNLRR